MPLSIRPEKKLSLISPLRGVLSATIMFASKYTFESILVLMLFLNLIRDIQPTIIVFLILLFLHRMNFEQIVLKTMRKDPNPPAE